MEKRTLNSKYLLERVVRKAYENSDVITLTRLLIKIINENEEIGFNLNLKTDDVVIFNLLIDELDCVINEVDGDIPGNFEDVSKGVVKLIKLHIDRCKVERIKANKL